MNCHFQSRFFCSQNWFGKIPNREYIFRIGEIHADNMLLVADRPVYSLHARFGPHAARGDGNTTDRHVKFTFGSLFGAQQSIEAFIPVEVMSMERPIRREANLKDSNVMLRVIFK